MVIVACCGLLLRSSFLAVATPLLLVGGLLSQVSLELELQTLRSLEFAVVQEAVAVGAQEEAAKDVGIAALNQAEADELTADATALQGAAAGEEADATAKEAGAAGAGEADTAAAGAAEADAVAAGEASAVEAGADAGEGVAAASDVASQVDAVSSAIMDALGEAGSAASVGADALGDAASTGLGAAGATAAETAAADAAAEAVAAGTAGTVATGAGVAAAPAVALGGATAAIAAEGPVVVAAAQEQWAAGSAEIQAASDVSLATEKEVQAGALEAAVPVLEEGAVSAQGAAATSALAGVGYLTAAAASQLIALAVQTPVACVVLTQWLCGAGASLIGGFAAIGGAYMKTKVVPGVDMPASDVTCAATAANVALAAALTSFMLGSWADIVLKAANLEEAGDYVMSQLSALPSLASKAVPILNKDNLHTSNSSRRLTPARPEASRKLADMWSSVADWAGQAAQEVEGSSEVALQRSKEFGNEGAAGLISHGKEFLKQGQAAAEDALHRSESAMPGILNTTQRLISQGKKTADKAIQDASRSARQQAVDVAKRIVVKAPNTRTTTIAPLKVPKPPDAVDYWHFLEPGFDRLKQSAGHWAMPVVLDVVLISCVFVVFELVIGIGRHLPAWRGRTSGPCAVAWRILSDVCSGWIWGMALLIAFWLLGILLAKELKPMAERIQDSPLHPIVPAVLGLLSMAMCVYHASSLAQLESSDVRELDVAEGDEGSGKAFESNYSLLPQFAPVRMVQTEKVEKPTGEQAAVVIMCIEWVLAAVLGLLGAVVSAVEGPMFTMAVGSSYKSVLMSWWILGLVPWEHLAPEVYGHKLPLFAVLGGVACFAVLLGGVLFLVKSRAVAALEQHSLGSGRASFAAVARSDSSKERDNDDVVAFAAVAKSESTKENGDDNIDYARFRGMTATSQTGLGL